MIPRPATQLAFALAALTGLAGAGQAHTNQDPAPVATTADSLEALRADFEALRQHNQALEERNEALSSSLDTQNRDWLTAERASEIRGIVQDVLSDSQSRMSLQDSGMVAGYKPGKGFFLGSQDGSFSLKVTGQLQTRWVLNYTKQSFEDRNSNVENSPKTTWGFQIRRAKVRFQGNVIDPSWKYQINGEFSSSSGRYDFAEALVQKVFDNGVVLTMGQFKTPWLREELVSSSRQLAVERSVVNEFFNQDRAVGLELSYRTDDWSLAGSYNNGQRTLIPEQTRYTNFLSNPTKWAFSSRFQWKLSGDWSDFKAFTGSMGQEQAVMIGVAVMGQQYNQTSGADNLFGVNTTALTGLNGDLTFNNSTVWGVTADISAKFENISLFAAGIFQRYDVKGRTDTGAAFELSPYDPWGMVVQGGYSLNDTVELFARYEYGNASVDSIETTVGGILANTATLNTEGGNVSILTVGANWFLNSKIKVTTDWGINFADNLSTFSDASDGWRSSGSADQWVLRAQLQLLF
ncbi:MAG: porin [Planctomycetota bacterium]|nr:porin [Planctomycetota bacterium]